MPSRILKESICYSDDIDCLTPFEETVFYRLMVRVDDYGRLDARPTFLCSQLFTTRTDITQAQIECAIDRLAALGLIACYRVADKPYLYICSWQQHQRLRCTKEKYPPPPQKVCGDLPQVAASGGSLPLTAARAGAESQSESQSESEVEVESVCATDRFIPPTIQEVDNYCKMNKYAVSAARFVDFYASKGWCVGISPMADWHAAVRRWCERDDTNCGGSARASPGMCAHLSTAKNYESEDCI
ncbi:MAG: hypothetical protein ACK5L0_07235 [Candidatus Fimivivens sp.]